MKHIAPNPKSVTLALLDRSFESIGQIMSDADRKLADDGALEFSLEAIAMTLDDELAELREAHEVILRHIHRAEAMLVRIATRQQPDN